MTRPDAPAGRGRTLVASPVKAARARSRHRGARPRTAERAGVPRPARASSPPTAVRSSPTARCCPPPRSRSPPTAGSTCTSRCCRPGAARPRCSGLSWPATSSPGRRTFRLEQGMDTGPVYGVLTERVRPTDTSGDLLDRLAEAGAELLLAHPRRHRGRLAARRSPQSARRRLARAQAHRRRRPGRLVRARGRGSTGWSAPRPRRPAPGRPGAASGSSSVRYASRPPSRSRAGRAQGRRPPRPRRHRPPDRSRSATYDPRARARWPRRDWARGVRPEPGERFV